MEIRNLNTFLKVAALQSFTQAGKELGYSQSNVSAQIKQLEADVGASLFDRIGKTVRLTQYGEALIPYARKIVSTALSMENFLKATESLGGTLHIGIVESLVESLMEETILRYHKRFPGVQIEISVDATATLKENLKRGLLDLACIIDDPLLQPEWNCRYALKAPVVVAANPLHPLSGKPELPLEALRDQECILMEESAPYTRQFGQRMAERNVELRPFLRLQSADMARRLVEREKFLAVIPLYTVKEAAGLGRLRILDLPELKLEQSIQFVLHRNKVPTPQIEGFIDALRQRLFEVMGMEEI